MGRGTRGILLAVVACAVLALPSPASAQGPLSIINHAVTVPVTIGPAPGTGSTLNLHLVSQVFRPYNFQIVEATLGPDPLVGVLVFHGYDRAADFGRYQLHGYLGGTPVLADIAIRLDRFGKVVIVSLAGTVGGQPIALSESVTIPV